MTEMETTEDNIEFVGNQFSFIWTIQEIEKFPTKILSPLISDLFDNVWLLMLHPRNDLNNNKFTITVKRQESGSPTNVVVYVKFLDGKGHSGVNGALSDCIVLEFPLREAQVQTVYIPFILASRIREILTDTLKVYCQIWIQDDENRWVSRTPHASLDKCTEFISSFKKIYQTKALSDFTVSVGNKNFQAHKCILAARSSVLHLMLTTEMHEAKNQTMEIRNFPAEIVRGMLEYIYTNEVNILSDTAENYLRIAHQFELDGLFVLAEYVLAESLTVDNVIEMWKLASLYTARFLMSKVVAIITRCYSQVVAAPAFAQLNKEEMLEFCRCAMIKRKGQPVT